MVGPDKGSSVVPAGCPSNFGINGLKGTHELFVVDISGSRLASLRCCSVVMSRQAIYIYNRYMIYDIYIYIIYTYHHISYKLNGIAYSKLV